MKLRTKTLLVTGLTLVGLILVLYAISATILSQGFARVEQQDVQTNVTRATAALSNDLATLEELTRDWAAWDDTYNFIEDGNEAFIQSNLADTTFTNSRLNLVMFIHLSGRFVAAEAYDLEENKRVPVPESIQSHLSIASPLLQHPDPQHALTGILLLPEGPLLIASEPIVTSEGSGPIHGTVIFGRYLNVTEMVRLARITGLSLTVRRFDDPQLPGDFTAVRADLEKELILVRPLSDQTSAGYTLVKDIYGNPALVLRVDLPRAIYAQSQISTYYLVLSLLVVGLVYGGVTLLLLERLVLSRLALFSTRLRQISVNGDLSAR
jgi:sensor domain CHASE-containing protein